MQWVAAQGAKRGHDFVQRVGVKLPGVGIEPVRVVQSVFRSMGGLLEE